MKYLLFFILLAGTIISCGPQLLGTVQYGENYKHTETKFERAGYTCEFAVLKIVNKTSKEKRIKINDSYFVIGPKDEIEVDTIVPGYNLIKDNYDQINLYCVPCNTYTHIYK